MFSGKFALSLPQNKSIRQIEQSEPDGGADDGRSAWGLPGVCRGGDGGGATPAGLRRVVPN